MIAYLPFVLFGTFVYRTFIYSPTRVSTRDKGTQTEPWCGMNILDLMDVSSDTTSSWEYEVENSSDCSSRETDKKNV